MLDLLVIDTLRSTCSFPTKADSVVCEVQHFNDEATMHDKQQHSWLTACQSTVFISEQIYLSVQYT